LTKEQLYSTASYQEKNLRGIGLSSSDLSGWDFSGQDLTNAYFGSDVLNEARLTNANLAGAIVTGASFGGTTESGFTKQQLYSTASYQQHNLRAIKLPQNNLSGWDFHGQNLAYADLGYSKFTNANLSGANLTNAYLFSNLYYPTLTNANLTAADLRGARHVNLTGAIVRNAIRPNGSVLGLDLAGGDELVVRDDDGVADPPAWWGPPRTPIPIDIRDHFAMSASGVLRLVFEFDPWDSLISFQPGIPVQLGGTLELTFADDVAVSTQVGRALHIFDWSGVAPTGAFGVDSPYMWDLSRLYTSGEVTLTAVPEPSTLLLFLCGLCAFGRFASRTVA
jgi:uncharacterized protein YjbI with pentapeptide repeats